VGESGTLEDPSAADLISLKRGGAEAPKDFFASFAASLEPKVR
jgi:hypothetical protein